MTIEAIKAKSIDELQQLAQWIADRNAYHRKCGNAVNGEDVHTLYMVEDELSIRREEILQG